jgi:hypothetical protein
VLFTKWNKKFLKNIEDKTMKKFLLIFALIGLLFYGCTNDHDITSPEQSTNIEPNWIKLPTPEGLQLNTDYTQTMAINGTQGGYLTCNFSYSGGSYGQVSASAELIITFGSYPGKKSISITLSDQNTSVIFGPELNFNSDVFYSVTYTGINLTGIDPQTVKFAYIANDGTTQIAQHEGITVNLSTGTLSVHNARLPHFSRYGFVN